MPMTYGLRNRPRILILDDEQTTTREFEAILQQHGYEVATALGGKEAFATAASFAPDLLVSEVGLGAKSGIKAAVKITEMVPGCKLLFLSTHMSMSEVSKAVSGHHVYSFTPKPLHPLDLMNAIGCMLPEADISGVSAPAPT